MTNEFEVMHLDILNEEELYERITVSIQAGMSANTVVSQIKNEINSIEDLEDRDFVEIALPSGAVFGRAQAIFYFDVVEVIREGELLIIAVSFMGIELI